MDESKNTPTTAANPDSAAQASVANSPTPSAAPPVNSSSEPISPKSGKKNVMLIALAVIAIVVLLLVLLLGVVLALRGNTEDNTNQSSSSSTNTESSDSSSMSSTASETSETTSVSSATSTETEKIYTHETAKFSFTYPDEWEVIATVPEKYKQKMLAYPCSGPVLQNTTDADQLIVFDIQAVAPDGTHCWSSGGFILNEQDPNRWKTLNPSGGETEWVGDYFKDAYIGESNGYNINAGLVNYETYSLKGEAALETIKTSFVANL